MKEPMYNRHGLGLGMTLAAAALAACSGSSTTTGAPSEEGEPLSSSAASTGTLVGLAGKCLDDYGDGTGNGNEVDLYTCNGTAAQKWTYTGGTLVGPGGKCLDVSGDVQANKTKVQLYACNGTKAQQWTFTDGQLHSAGGLCLNVANANPASGTPLELYECVAGGASELWTFTGAATTVDAGTGGGGGATDAGKPPPAAPDAGETADSGSGGGGGGGSGGGTGACSGASTSVDGIADAAHASGQAPPTCTPAGFKIAYIDDFPGSSLASGWTLPSGFQYGEGWVSSGMITVHDGLLDIGETYSGKSGDEPVVGWAQLTNTPAALLKYGKLLVRQRADIFEHVEIATLTWPVAANVWPPEVDFVEDDDGDRHWYAFNHYKDSSGTNQQTWEDSGLTSDAWHTWGIEWTPSAVTYTRDGAVWKVETDPEVIPSIQMYLGFVMATHTTPKPGSAHWQMDWVALYGMD